MAEFQAGDKVKNTDVGSHIFTVKSATTNQWGIDKVELEGHPGVFYNSSSFRLVHRNDPLDAFKKALDELRSKGYDVKVTVSRTVVEEL